MCIEQMLNRRLGHAQECDWRIYSACAKVEFVLFRITNLSPAIRMSSSVQEGCRVFVLSSPECLLICRVNFFEL